MARLLATVPVVLAIALASSGCFPHGGRAGMVLESCDSERSRPPAVRRHHPSAVVFGVPDGRTWRIVPYEGADRDAALAWFRTGQPLPHGLFAVAQTPSGYELVTPDMVRW